MYELLREFPKGSVVLVERAQRAGISRDDRVLDVPTFEVGKVTSQVYVTAFRFLLLPLVIISMLLKLKSLGRKPRNILAVHPDLDFLLASLFLARLLDVPIFVYLHDCIVEAATLAFDKFPSRIAQRLVFTRAVKVYSMSEPMERFFAQRGLKTEALPHGVDAKLMRHPVQKPCTPVPKVGFTGAVYGMNGSAVKDLVLAKELAGGKLELLFATSQQSLPYMDEIGVRERIDKVVTIPTREKVLDFLSECDILFVPMGFESPYYKDLLTVFPTKVTDYWLAQKPIIVYGPKEYAFLGLAETDGSAKIVSERGPEKLLAAIQEICRSPVLRQKLVVESRNMIKRHDNVALARRLMADLGIQG